MVSLTWEQVNTYRLAQHSLSQRADRQHRLEVVSAIGVLQAQMMSAAELQLWARVDDLAADDIEQELWTDRTLIKTWAIRGTLHLLTAQDFPLYIGALSTLRHFRRNVWLKNFGVTMVELDALIEGVRLTLSDTGMTREALADAVALHANTPHLRDLLVSGWGSLLKPAAFQGYLCFGPNAGKNVTFVQPHKWLGKLTPVDSQAALHEVLRRFLTAYGPATVPEFARWIGLEQSAARKQFKALDSEIEAVEVDGWKSFALASTIPMIQHAKPPAAPVVRLLPNFDPYTIAVAPHHRYLMPEADKGKVYRSQGWISPAVIVDGRIVGIWEYDKQKKAVAVQLTLFSPVSAEIKDGIEAEAQRLARFLLEDESAKATLTYA